ncbi:MAG: 3-methyladenine DNA glycosylase [Propionibacteriales bacterium]|nr:3-methyladenine DNA glycosylase [Propionibacteriales bacterium]
MVLDEPTWRRRRAAHEARVDPWLAPHLERRRRGEKHPVEDFLFTYYANRPAALRRWHPGPGVVLAGASPLRGTRGYVEGRDGVRLDPAYVRDRADVVRRTRDLIVATRDRAPSFGCLGLHEWAMVYRQSPDQIRHAAWPLRLGAAGTDAVVEGHRIRCTHFDAFRFFTDPARSLNTVQPGPSDRVEHEQPGCLHATMDLYKHAFVLAPMTPSELVADCFELARDVRTLDMRASPYDLTGLGYEPVRIETPEGKLEYAEAQRGFATRAAPLRTRLIDLCERLLSGAT